VLTAVLSGIWVAAILAGFGGRTTSNLGLIVASALAAAACLGAARRASGRSRRVWALLGFSALSWAVGQVAWTWYETVLGQELPLPSLADVGYLGAVPLAAAALLAVPVPSQGLAGRARTVLDGLMIAGSMLLVSWTLLLGPLVHAGGDGLVAQVISLAYPIGDVVVVTIVVYILARFRRAAGSAPIPLALIGLGLVSIAFADSGFALLTLKESYTSGSFIDCGWFLGYALLLLAARKPARAAAGGAADAVSARPLGLLLPYIAVVVAMAVSMSELFRRGGLDPFVAWDRTFIVLMMVGRQLLTLLENQGLTKHLEARVADRTAELLASEQRFEALVQHSSDVVTVVDQGGRVLYQSESVHGVFGYTAESLLGRPLGDVLAPDESARLVEALAEAARRPYGTLVLELPLRHHAGHVCQAEMTVTNLLSNPAVGGLVLNTRDISERKQLEDQLVHEAFHDSLTLLANRALFKDRLDQALHRNRRGPEAVAVLFLDLDGFKEVNDSLGHATGDQLLIQVADRLRACVRPGDTVARFGGDEFAVLVEDSTGELDAVTVAERITASMRERFEIEGHEIHVRGSVGIASADADADGSDQLLRNADLAMYRAKSAGQGGFEEYDPAMHRGLVERLELEADLRRAVEVGELELYYQPTVSLASGAIIGVEALLRWHHPTRGLVPPAQFIPLAESTGLINPIGRWVLAEACKQAVAWQRQHPGQTLLTMSVNISGRQLQSPGLADDVADALEASGLSPACLVLEMTESVLMTDTEENLELLQRLKDKGIRLAIDDFGTGYSSLSYLHRFPVDILKIDRSFVERLSERSDDAELAGTIVRLGQSLRMSTIAEGIEDHEQLDALRRMACDLGQGFYLARPVPAAQIDQLLGVLGGDADQLSGMPPVFSG
jgi:diguanylate cyclase (GGDEF)-like protein/PAS domain S-box-containing protein